MRLKIQLLKLLLLPCIGLYLAIKFLSRLTAQTHCYVLNYCSLGNFMLRIIMACIASMYYLYLDQKNKIGDPRQRSANVYGLTIGTIGMQLLMTFALILLNNIKEALWDPSAAPALCFSSKIDFLCRGVLEISCLAAILEEVLFRGILEKLVSKVTPVRLWITIISALAFSLMHCNMSNNLLYFIMGCFLSQLHYQTQHIIYPIIAHGLHNLCAAFMMYLTWDKRFNLVINKLPIVIRTMLVVASLLAVYGYIHYMLVNPKTKDII